MMDVIFNMFKVRFVKLDELIMKYCKEINPNSRVNLFINLEPILRKLTTSNIEQYLEVKTEEKVYEMISNIINLIAHYRLFFTKNKIYSKVYVYLNYPFKTIYKNRLINIDYRRSYEHRYTKDARSTTLTNTLDTVIPFIKVILEYVQGVYFIGADSIESSIVPKIISDTSEENYINFMVTTDRYDYQYVNKGFYIIRPKQEDSYMVCSENLFRMMKLEEKIVNGIELGNQFLPFVLSILGDKNRNIPKIKKVGLSSVMKMIRKAIDDGIVGKDVSNINILSNILKQDYKAIVLSNYYCTDIDTQFSMLNIKDVYSITDQIKDKFDNVSLKSINDQYFIQYPIYLVELTAANNLLKGKVKKNVFL